MPRDLWLCDGCDEPVKRDDAVNLVAWVTGEWAREHKRAEKRGVFCSPGCAAGWLRGVYAHRAHSVV